jgi:hypothetical protein
MQYEVKRVVEEIDVISLSQEEFDNLNNFYRQIISKRFPRLAELNHIYDLKRLIMSDDLSRVEVLVAVNGSTITPVNVLAGTNRPIPEELK